VTETWNFNAAKKILDLKSDLNVKEKKRKNSWRSRLVAQPELFALKRTTVANWTSVTRKRKSEEKITNENSFGSTLRKVWMPGRKRLPKRLRMLKLALPVSD
jgi:hypothetical protein